ncbi:hypothetical protein A2U01_0116513, partial [Trifolium medium]|nr:hypothetical protein [Trifolium medium]
MCQEADMVAQRALASSSDQSQNISQF